jgi:hypothetical protein
MYIIVTSKTSWFQAGAITVWPFLFIHPLLADNLSVRTHERVHWEQQRRWVIYGLGVGLLLWFVLYLFVLPIGWNPFRKHWEQEAYRKEGYSNEAINNILRGPPYYLWF